MFSCLILYAACFLMIFQVEMRRANNCEIMLTKIKMPLSDMIVSVCDSMAILRFVIENSA
jgi:hypothetical protein